MLAGVEQGRSIHFEFKNTRPFLLEERPAPPRETIPNKGIIVNLIRQERQDHREYFFSKNWLEDNVNDERQKRILPGEVPWYHLAGTGFWVKEQTAQLVRNTKGAMREVAPDVLELELAKVKADKLAFVDEYLEQMLNLKFNLGWKEVDGEQRIVCPDYGNVLWESVTDPMERDGAVYEAIAGNKETGAEGLETKLRKAPNGSMGIAISNEGWSGLHDADGQEITFPETQIYLIKKDVDGTLQAYTMRYKANIEQNEELQRQLGQTVKSAPNERERIKNLIKNTAIITPDDAARAEAEGRRGVRDFTDVVDLMQHVVGGRVVAYEGKTFDEMRYLLKHPEAFIKPHPLVIPLIERFQTYARQEILREQPLATLETKLQIAMAFTILQMNKLYREEEQQSQRVQLGTTRLRTESSSTTVDNAIMVLNNINVKKEVEDLQERPGCAGGGSTTKKTDKYSYNKNYTTSMGTVRSGVSGGDGEEYTGENAKDDPNLCRCGQGDGPHFHCPSGGCGHAISVGKGISACPACGTGKTC